MAEFFSFGGSFINLIAQFFELRVPYIGISFFQLLAAILIIRVGITVLKIIFGIDHSGDET